MLGQILALDPRLLAALGTVGSAALAALAFIAKLRHERKRTLRMVLFLLLQLRRQAVLSNLYVTEFPSGAISALNRILASMGLEINADQREQLLADALPGLVAAANTSAREERAELRAALVKAIGELGRDNPLLAYRLSTGIPAASANTLQSELSATAATEPNPALAFEVGERFSVALHAVAERARTDSLSTCIHLAALRAGPLSFMGALLALRVQNHFRPSENFFDELMAPMRQVLQSQLGKTPPSASEKDSVASTVQPYR